MKKLRFIYTFIFAGRLATSQYYALYLELFQASDCSIPVSGLADPEPLLLVPGTTTLVRGNTHGNIVLRAGQTVRLACPGTVLTVTGTPEATATCVGGVQLSVNGRTYNANRLGCTRPPTPHSWAAGSCMGGRELALMGYQTSAGNVQLIEACHDRSLHHTLYAKFTLRPEASRFRRGISRADWINGHLFA
jgi:hypothetical protein